MKSFSFLSFLAVLAVPCLLAALPAQASSTVYGHATVTDPTAGQTFHIPGYDPYPHFTGFVNVGFNTTSQDVGITGGDPNTDYHVTYSLVLYWHPQTSGQTQIDADPGASNATVTCNSTGVWTHPAKGSGSLSGGYSFYSPGTYYATATSTITNTVSGQGGVGGNEHVFYVTN